MSNQGQGQGRTYRGGRSGGRSNQGQRSCQSNNCHPERRKKTINDYFYYVGSTKQASDYEATNKFIINCIQKTFTNGRDIATALYNLYPVNTALWRPQLEQSTIIVVSEETRAMREAEN